MRARAAGGVRRAHRATRWSRRPTRAGGAAGNKGYEAAEAALAHRPTRCAQLRSADASGLRHGPVRRALQMLYAWELQGRPPVHEVATGLSRLTGPEPAVLDGAEELAAAVSSPTWTSSIARPRRPPTTGGSSASRSWSATSCGSPSTSCRTATVPPKVAIDEAVRLAHWFGGAKRAGVRQRRARPRRPFARASVNILLVNWQDRDNPQAGGAEIHLFEIFGRLAARGHRVRLVCSGWPGAPPRAMVDGIEVSGIGDAEQLRPRWDGAPCGGDWRPSGPTSWSRTSTSFRCSWPA